MGTSSNGLDGCPFGCGFTDPNNYTLLLHVETAHSEGVSGFAVQDDGELQDATSLEKPSPGSPASDGVKLEESSAEEDYVECPEEGCGESISHEELQSHLDLHLAEKMTYDVGSQELDDEQSKNKSENLYNQNDISFTAALPDPLRNLGSAGSSKQSQSAKLTKARARDTPDLMSMFKNALWRGRETPTTTKEAGKHHRRLGVSSLPNLL